MAETDIARLRTLEEHAFEPDHLRAAVLRNPRVSKGEAAARIQTLTRLIDAEHCPRCAGPLLGANSLSEHVYPPEVEEAMRASIAEYPSNPDAQEHPAHSRITECRCIPICTLCGSHEVLTERCIGSDRWPLDRDWIIGELREVNAGMQLGSGR